LVEYFLHFFLEQLSKKHNKGVPIPITLRWADFMNFTFKNFDRDSGAIVEYRVEKQKIPFQDDDHKDWLRKGIGMKIPKNKLVACFELLEKFTEKQLRALSRDQAEKPATGFI
jgi:hypothetical protein